MLPSSPRRWLVLAATAFILTSVYLCGSRLSDQSYEREPAVHAIQPTQGKGDAASKDDGILQVKLNHADLQMSYGQFARPSFADIKLIEALPEEFVPTAQNGRRLIIIGDIHGMDTELQSLLEKASYDGTRDHVIAVGDMVNKGPDSAGVVSRLMTLNASAVRGNHEDKILLAHKAIQASYGASKDLETQLDQENNGQLRDLVLARHLSKDHIKWLSQRPAILTVDQLNMYIVHAGLVPGVELEKQDPWAVMNMRTLTYPREELREKAGEEPRLYKRDDAGSNAADDDTADMDDSVIPFDRRVALPNEGHKGRRWTDAWNKYQQRLPRRLRRTVVYGHNAKSGYKESKYTIGLDSACVKGGALSALIVEAGGSGGFKHKTLQVRCRASESTSKD
jgi:bis(5'-nucleosyl)-tetraphosphatase (symmetrical)